MTATVSKSHHQIRKETVGSVNAEWREELTLIGNLATVNRRISAYVARALDVDADRTEPTAPANEYALGTRLIDLGTDLQTRATQRSTNVRDCSPGEHPVRHAAKPNRPCETKKPWVNHATAIYMSE
jgi:hypothetical protein